MSKAYRDIIILYLRIADHSHKRGRHSGVHPINPNELIVVEAHRRIDGAVAIYAYEANCIRSLPACDADAEITACW